MTDKELLNQALEYLEDNQHWIADGERHAYFMEYNAFIDKLKQALAQQKQPAQQEPIGDDWMPCMKLPVVVHVRQQRKGETHVSTREGITPVKPDDLIMRGVSGEEYPIGRAIFEQTYSFDTTPPQRTWVGLTDEEIQTEWVLTPQNDKAEGIWFGRRIEAKSKEKNT